MKNKLLLTMSVAIAFSAASVIANAQEVEHKVVKEHQGAQLKKAYSKNQGSKAEAQYEEGQGEYAKNVHGNRSTRQSNIKNSQ